MFNAFETFVKQYGRDATIIYRTPQMRGGSVVKDAKNHTIYDEEEVECRMRLKVGGGGKGYAKNPNAFQIKYDAVGLFMLKDKEYLNTDSRIKVEFAEGITKTFQMKSIKFQATHMMVGLNSREV